jgi:hypothetical protein
LSAKFDALGKMTDINFAFGWLQMIRHPRIDTGLTISYFVM